MVEDIWTQNRASIGTERQGNGVRAASPAAFSCPGGRGGRAPFSCPLIEWHGSNSEHSLGGIAMPEKVTPGPVQEDTCIREAVCIDTRKIFDSCKEEDIAS